jgi:hypothetical protein
LGSIANWVLLASLVGGVFSTFVIVKTADVKEARWEEERRASNEKIAALNNETEHLKADNLALQTVMLPSPSYSAGLEFELTGVAQSAELA